MASVSNIEWTERVWNPVAGCQIVSPGCTNCYAMKMAARLEAMGVPQYKGLAKPTKAGPVWTGEFRIVESAISAPLRVRKPTTWFVNSMSDLFAPEVIALGGADLAMVVMALTPQHTYQILTKRPAEAAEFLADFNWRDAIEACRDDRGVSRILKHSVNDLERLLGECPRFSYDADRSELPLTNVIIGSSVEDQKRADERRPFMAQIAELGWRTFVSYEPALGPVDWTGWEFLRWLIAGGENSPKARVCHPEWFRIARDFCAAHGIPFFFKQWGSWLHMPERAHFKDSFSQPWERASSQMAGVRPALMFRVGKKRAGRLLDGVTHDARPSLSLPNGVAPSLPLHGVAQ